MLESISQDDVDDDAFSRIMNALEQLDNLLLDASAHDIATAASGRQQRAAPEARNEEPTETPDEVVMRRHAEADRLDSVPITIELSSPLIELIDHVRKTDEDETVTDWIKRTIQTRLARHDHEFWNSVTVPVEAELPPEAAQWARLWADHWTATGSEPHDIETHLMDYIDLEFDWRVEGGGELDVASDLPGQCGEETVDLSEVTATLKTTRATTSPPRTESRPMGELTAPSEGAADTPTEIADELCDALLAFDHVDYNALLDEDLQRLLEIHDEVRGILRTYRESQPSRGNRSDGE